MGHPRHFKNKYESPKRLWDKDRIQIEGSLKKEYGLKNIREIWIAAAELKKYRREARRLLSMLEEERTKDLPKIIARLNRLSILGKEATLEDILSLEIRSVLERRLQTRVFKKGLAKTFKQARQLITHGFIGVNGRKLTSPGHLITQEEDDKIAYYKTFNMNINKVKDEEPETKVETKEVKTETPKVEEKKPEPKTEKKEEKKPEPKTEKKEEKKPEPKKDVKKGDEKNG